MVLFVAQDDIAMDVCVYFVVAEINVSRGRKCTSVATNVYLLGRRRHLTEEVGCERAHVHTKM